MSSTICSNGNALLQKLVLRFVNLIRNLVKTFNTNIHAEHIASTDKGGGHGIVKIASLPVTERLANPAKH